MENPQSGITASQKTQSIRLRAVGVGLVLAVLVCALTPFNNDYR